MGGFLMRRTIVIILPVLLIGVLTYSIYKANWQNPFSDSFSGDLDDSEIHIRSFEDARALRQQALEFIWPGEKRLPTQLPDQVLKDTPSPFLETLENLGSVDRFTVSMRDGQFTSVSFLFHPQKELVPKRLMIFHQGHSGTLVERGGLDTIQFFLKRGYAVLTFYMPLRGPNLSPFWNDKKPSKHDYIFKYTPNPMAVFLQPVRVVLNSILNAENFSEVDMIGISGGGWTTTLYAALDPAIKNSIPVAGSLPIYMRNKYERDKRGDEEQVFNAMYRIVGYPDLYMLAALEPGRKQIQILNRQDRCCFKVASEPDYVALIQNQLSSISGGNYFFELDNYPGHMITDWALNRAEQYLQ